MSKADREVFELPTLYKQTATGAVQQWTVKAVRHPDIDENREVIGELGTVFTEYGQVGGALQRTSDTISKGKNLGKKNETTPYEQACAEAQQHWDKKRKKGYTTNRELAASTDNVLDGIKPMLAHVYQDHPKKVTWPAAAQPKLDGMRCIAIMKGGRCTLYSRSQKLIETVPHINKAVEKLSGGVDLILDGELYSHDLKDDFNRIMSLSKRKEVHPDHELIQFHVYDMPSLTTYAFRSRWAVLGGMFERNDSPSLQLVETVEIADEEELFEYLSECLENGYEGAMYRNTEAAYENKRSAGLLKLKVFYDETLCREEEFVAVDVKEGRGKLRGKAGAIWCVTKDGKRFKAVMVGALPTLTDYFTSFEEKYRGQPLTVRFLNYTPDGIPRCGKGIRFKEAE